MLYSQTDKKISIKNLILNFKKVLKREIGLKMKQFILFLILFTPFIVWGETNEKEIIFYVEMTINEKSQVEIEKFSNHYQDRVNVNEAGALEWKFFKSDTNKVIEIIRWSDSDAIKIHIENISEVGFLQKDFESYTDHYVINEISVLGQVTEEVKLMLLGIGVPIAFSPLIAGFSK